MMAQPKIAKGMLVRMREDDGSLSTWIGQVFRIDVRRGAPIVEASGNQRRREAHPDRFVIVEG